MLWESNGQLLVDASGSPIECDHCPCEEGSGSGSGPTDCPHDCSGCPATYTGVIHRYDQFGALIFSQTITLIGGVAGNPCEYAGTTSEGGTLSAGCGVGNAEWPVNGWGFGYNIGLLAWANSFFIGFQSCPPTGNYHLTNPDPTQGYVNIVVS